MGHARRKATPGPSRMSREPAQRSQSGPADRAPTVSPDAGSTTPVLDQVGQQGGQAPGSSAPSESRMSASEATKDRLARELHNGRTGSTSLWLKVGIERRLGSLASIGLDFGLKLAVNFDNDRRVRASIQFDVTFKAAVDLLLFKAGLSFDIGGSFAGVWNSPDHFYAYVQQRIGEVEKASDTYLSKKAGAAGRGQSAAGTQAPTSTLDGTPSMGVSTASMGVDLAFEKGKLLKRMPWLSAVGSLKWETFAAHRMKDGKRQELHGHVVRGITKLQTGLGSAEVEYSVTENHPNPDQNGVFWDLRLELGRGNSPKVKASEIKALEAQMKGWSQATGKNPITKAKA